MNTALTTLFDLGSEDPIAKLKILIASNPLKITDEASWSRLLGEIQHQKSPEVMQEIEAALAWAVLYQVKMEKSGHVTSAESQEMQDLALSAIRGSRGTDQRYFDSVRVRLVGQWEHGADYLKLRIQEAIEGQERSRNPTREFVANQIGMLQVIDPTITIDQILKRMRQTPSLTVNTLHTGVYGGFVKEVGRLFDLQITNPKGADAPLLTANHLQISIKPHGSAAPGDTAEISGGVRVRGAVHRLGETLKRAIS